jgi:aspartyl-tRNA(Asn)/glutamyl-tRNA(Gln) amidotransferase subunit A
MTASMDLSSLTLHDTLVALEARQFSTVELIRATLERMLETEETLHAFVDVHARDAMEHAMIADRRRQIPRPAPPLLGIPLGIKDIFDIAGKPTRCNSALREDAPVAVRDADAVHAWRRDGAILIGKTVTQEFAAGIVSAPARNPWDPERIPGGSSGGSAAAVAAGTCLGALGSDTGGSIRIPASVTGTVGLKPTYGRIGTSGTYPLSASLDTVGPIARTVPDAALLFLSLANRTKEIPEAVSRLQHADGSLAGRRIGVLTTFFQERLQPDVATAFDQALKTLEQLGAEIIECEWSGANAARAAAMVISRVESAAVHRDALRATPDLMGEDLRTRLEVGAILPADAYLRARQAREAVTRSIAEVYTSQRLDAIVTPTLPTTAPRADDLRVCYADGTEEPAGTALTRLTAPWNTTGQPVISVPCGFDAKTLPIGLSFVGRPDAELDLCALARAYEQATGWHTRRPTVATPDA